MWMNSRTPIFYDDCLVRHLGSRESPNRDQIGLTRLSVPVELKLPSTQLSIVLIHVHVEINDTNYVLRGINFFNAIWYFSLIHSAKCANSITSTFNNKLRKLTFKRASQRPSLLNLTDCFWHHNLGIIFSSKAENKIDSVSVVWRNRWMYWEKVAFCDYGIFRLGASQRTI